MARKHLDYVIEAVHYSPSGEIEWVRGYERRGLAYSDLVVLNRDELIHRLKEGQRIAIGQRKPYMGHTFDIQASVRLVTDHGKEVITTEGTNGEKDTLSAPVV